MIARQYRFHGHGSLRYVSKNAQAVRSKWLAIKAVSNRFRPHSRIAVVVSRKIHKRATVRNRIRRRIYEELRLTLPHIKNSFDIVVIVTSLEIMTTTSQELHDILYEQLHRAEILTK